MYYIAGYFDPSIIVHIKHFGLEELVMLKSTPVKVPAADVATLAPSFTTTETVEHPNQSGNWNV
jgi:hypothetical protein